MNRVLAIDQKIIIIIFRTYRKKLHRYFRNLEYALRVERDCARNFRDIVRRIKEGTFF